MDDIIQPLISIPTTETMMYIVGFVEFLLSFAFALLWFICFSNYDKQSRIIKKVIIAHAVGWLVLIFVGLLLIPNERTGSYLDVYANLALANIGFMMVLAGVCAMLIASVPKTGIAFTKHPVTIVSGNNRFSANQLTVYTQDDRMALQGQVNATFYPNTIEKL